MLLFAAVFGVLFLIVVLCVGLGMSVLETGRRRRVRQMLETMEQRAAAPAELVRMEEQQRSLAKVLSELPPVRAVEALLDQSRTGWNAATLAGFSLLGAIAGVLAGTQLRLLGSARIGSAVLGAAGLAIPTLHVLRKRSKALSMFEKQLPEALDFLARSMRAGHGFSISLEMLATESAEPLASVFKQITREMQMGAPLTAALRKLETAAPLVDVRFFVSSVLLQQETGGNLSEILTKLAHVIRERFQLRGQVKALSAHGRITGLVLLLMPVGVTLLLLAMSPDYLQTLMDDHHGRMMLAGAVIGQMLSYLSIKKIVNIKV